MYGWGELEPLTWRKFWKYWAMTVIGFATFFGGIALIGLMFKALERY